MDIYQHILENIRYESDNLKKTKQSDDKKFYVPLDMRDIEKQKKYKEQRNKNSKKVVKFEKSHIIFEREWKELNTPQKINRLIEYSYRNNLDKNKVILAYNQKRIKDIIYDEEGGKILEVQYNEE